MAETLSLSLYELALSHWLLEMFALLNSQVITVKQKGVNM